MAMGLKKLTISALGIFKLRVLTLTADVVFWFTEESEEHVTEAGERIFLD